MCELQQGATATLSDDSGLLGVINIGRFGAPIPVIDDTDLSSTASDGRKKCPGLLRDPQMFTITMRAVGEDEYPTVGLIQDLTIVRPIPPGFTGTGDTLDGEGFVVDVRTPEHQSDSEGRQTIEVDWQYSQLPTREEADLEAV